MKEHSMLKRKITIVTDQNDFQNAMPVIMADSIEVMENYYRDRIKVMESNLARLNILENSKEIFFLCREISQAKKILRKIFLNKKI